MPRSDCRFARYFVTRLTGSLSRQRFQRSGMSSPVSRLNGRRKPLGAFGIRIVGRGHAQVHDRVALGHARAWASSSTASRKRFTRPSSRPASAPFSIFVTSYGARLARDRRGTWRARSACSASRASRRSRSRRRPSGRRSRPSLRVLHAVDDGAVAARGFAEAAAVLARGERAELAVDEGHDLLREVVGVVADAPRS